MKLVLGFWFPEVVRSGQINDQVTGYTLANFLRESFGLSTLSAQLKTHRLAGVTEAQIDQLLS